jgi:hypothetical protein
MLMADMARGRTLEADLGAYAVMRFAGRSG